MFIQIQKKIVISILLVTLKYNVFVLISVWVIRFSLTTYFFVDATTKEVLECCGGNGIPVKKLAIHIDGYFVAHLCDGSLCVISINGQQLCRAHIGEHLNAMIICSKSNSIVTGGSMGCVRIWKLDDLSLQCTIDVKKHGSITSLAFTPDKQFLCIGSVAGLVSIVSRIPE